MLEPFVDVTIHCVQGTGRLCSTGWVLQEADSGLEFSEQNIDWEALQTVTPVEGREGSRIGKKVVSCDACWLPHWCSLGLWGWDGPLVILCWAKMACPLLTPWVTECEQPRKRCDLGGGSSLQLRQTLKELSFGSWTVHLSVHHLM